MEEINQIITATGTSILALGAVFAAADYKRRLNIKRKSYLTKQINKYNEGISRLYNSLVNPESNQTKASVTSLKVFIFEVNALLSTTIFTAEALEYSSKDETERVEKSNLHKRFVFFNKNCANEKVVKAINELSKFSDDFYDKKIGEQDSVEFKEVFSFYLHLKGKVMEVSSAVR